MVSQVALEAPGSQPAVLEADPANLFADAKPTTDDSSLRHETYFFKDGNVTFLVRVALLCAPDSLTDQVTGQWHALLRSSVLLLAGLGLLLHQVFSARRPRSRISEHFRIVG
jgi:hypothetical protein